MVSRASKGKAGSRLVRDVSRARVRASRRDSRVRVGREAKVSKVDQEKKLVTLTVSDGALLAYRLIVFREPRNFGVLREIMNQTSICFRRFSRFSAALCRAWKRSASR